MSSGNPIVGDIETETGHKHSYGAGAIPSPLSACRCRLHYGNSDINPTHRPAVGHWGYSSQRQHCERGGWVCVANTGQRGRAEVPRPPLWHRADVGSQALCGANPQQIE